MINKNAFHPAHFPAACYATMTSNVLYIVCACFDVDIIAETARTFFGKRSKFYVLEMAVLNGYKPKRIFELVKPMAPIV